MTQYLSYVYAYLRTDGTPYYIGKGKNKRAFSKAHTIAVPEDKSRIIFLETNLSDIGATALERRYIAWYGRKDINTGILRNLTDGGEGMSGHIFSYTHRKKISEAARNISKETRQKMSESMKRVNRGRIHSSETKRKTSESMKLYWRKHIASISII